MIRYNVQLRTYVNHNFSELANTAGKLMLGGEFAIMNTPTTASIYILNYTTMMEEKIKPLITATAETYSF